MSANEAPSADPKYQPVALKSVLVIGYGVAGSAVACQLAANNKDLKVTVITPFEFMEVPFSMTYNLAAGPEAHAKYLFPLLKQPSVDYKIATCSSLTNDSCTTSTGEVIPFDICVVATGVKYPIFQADPHVHTKEERVKLVSDYHEKIKAAKSIVISGGGPVGSETAADIKLRFPEKTVTIVHPVDNILQNMTAQYSQLATAAIKNQGVVLVKGHVESVSEDASSGHAVRLASGEVINCDLYIKSNYSSVNSTFMPKTSLDDKGRIIVDDHLSVKGMNHVFAIGDCSNRAAPSAIQAGDQVPTILKNVVALTQNKPLSVHVPAGIALGSGPMMVALGHNHPNGYGVGPDLPGCLSWIPWLCCLGCGPPCSPSVGAGVAKMKTDFNSSIAPRIDRGLAQ